MEGLAVGESRLAQVALHWQWRKRKIRARLVSWLVIDEWVSDMFDLITSAWLTLLAEGSGPTAGLLLVCTVLRAGEQGVAILGARHGSAVDRVGCAGGHTAFAKSWRSTPR